jgi:hypothetical protein
MSTTQTTALSDYQASRASSSGAHPPAGWTFPVPPERAAAIANWLDGCELEGAHPGSIDERLRREGWSPAQSAAVAEEYRQRFNEHALGYTGLLVATGLAALAAATAGHLLAAGLDGPVNRNGLALWLTLLVCAVPFAAWSHWWAATVDRDDPAAVWSRPRRQLARVLLWGSGVVGIARLMVFVARLIGVLVGATWARGSSAVAGSINVAITIAIALPLGLWAFRFLHRFDDEDPTSPAEHHRRRSQPTP